MENNCGEIIDEKTFYGDVSRGYVLERDNLKELYKDICSELSLHSQKIMDGRYSCKEEAVIHIDYYVNPRELITIHFTNLIGERLFSPETDNLSNVLENLVRKNGFKLME